MCFKKGFYPHADCEMAVVAGPVAEMVTCSRSFATKMALKCFCRTELKFENLTCVMYLVYKIEHKSELL